MDTLAGLPPSRLGVTPGSQLRYEWPDGHPSQKAAGPGDTWQKHTTTDGRQYYHNHITQQSQWDAPACMSSGGGSAGSAAAFMQKQQQQHRLNQQYAIHQKMLWQQAQSAMHGDDRMRMMMSQSSMSRQGPQICELCFGTNGKHSKKCAFVRENESQEDRAKRLKREERLRDQELGAEYVDAEKQAEKTFTDYTPSRFQTPLTFSKQKQQFSYTRKEEGGACLCVCERACACVRA